MSNTNNVYYHGQVYGLLFHDGKASSTLIYTPGYDPYDIMDTNGESYDDIIMINFNDAAGMLNLIDLLDAEAVTQVYDNNISYELEDVDFAITSTSDEGEYDFDTWAAAQKELVKIYGR